ncbi:NAD(P)/FAD-dependent oxidoreductase [Streptomyces atratus]|uniref:NAD(P)/FAD-dependent oxidoreductase n=1 Tax=Streptomyces atratus TaxID=1893 RepID=UPI003255F2F1
MNRILIVGAGPAAHRLAERLRHHGHAEALTVLGAEPAPAHHRPLLSHVVAGRLTPEALRMPFPPGTRVLTDTMVTGIDRERREVRAQRGGVGTVHPYDTLVLATGARAAVPAIPGATGDGGRTGDGVTTLRTAADCERITGDTVVVLGGGPLGVETASALAARGTATTLVCDRPHPLYERLGDTGGGMLTELLAREGVRVLGGRTVVRRTPGSVLLDDGTTSRADTLVLCTGAVPAARLARQAGLEVRDGIVVDDRLRTGDPRIHAIGDCAEHRGRAAAGLDAAWAQAEDLAEILTGRDTAHRPVPPVFRLRTRAVDVSCIGSPDAFEAPGVRMLGFTDRDGHRYARLALRDERVVAAVLFGLPQAIATIGLLHRRGQQLPSDRLGLLLGWPPRPSSRESDTYEDAMICLCNNVRRRTLSLAWRAGARTVTALAAATRATTGCGGCGPQVAEQCDLWESEARREPGRAA